MKRLAVVAIIIFILAFQVAVFAVELSSEDNSGERVSLFGDIAVDKATKGDIVSVAGNIAVHESVSGNITAVIGDINTFRGATGGLVAVFGDINMQGDVNGDVITVLGDTVINGKVSGQVVSVLGRLTLSDNAEVENGIVSIGDVDSSSKAKIHGSQDIIGLGFLPDARAVLSILMILFSVLVLVIGVLAISIQKARFENISTGIENNFWRKLIWGLTGFLGFTILVPILSITVIAPLIYVVLLIMAEIVTSIFLGKLLLKAFNSNTNIYLEFMTGLICLSILKITLIIFAFQSGVNLLVFGGISLICSILINSIGIGILIDTRFGSLLLKSSGR